MSVYTGKSASGGKQQHITIIPRQIHHVITADTTAIHYMSLIIIHQKMVPQKPGRALLPSFYTSLSFSLYTSLFLSLYLSIYSLPSSHLSPSPFPHLSLSLKRNGLPASYSQCTL